MDQEVGGEGGAPLEALPTLLALEQLLGAVDCPEQSTVKTGHYDVPLLPHHAHTVPTTLLPYPPTLGTQPGNPPYQETMSPAQILIRLGNI